MQTQPFITQNRSRATYDFLRIKRLLKTILPQNYHSYFIKSRIIFLTSNATLIIMLLSVGIENQTTVEAIMVLKYETRQTQSKTSRTLITLVGTGLAFRSDKVETAQSWESKQEAVAFAKTLGFAAKHVCAAWLNRLTWGWIIRGELDDVYCQDGQMRLAQE